jgi:hypothetical protein
MTPLPPLPGFRATTIGVGATWSLLALSMLVRGIPSAMAAYAVPGELLQNALYVDAMTWVFLHMLFIGLLTLVLGLTSHDGRQQRLFSRLLLAAVSVYLFLDARAADWPLGTALYKGPGSLGPVVVGAVAFVFWARLAFLRHPSSPSVDGRLGHPPRPDGGSAAGESRSPDDRVAHPRASAKSSSDDRVHLNPLTQSKAA